MMEPFWHEATGEGPLVAVALHDGHELRPEVAGGLGLDDQVRLREEDPFTGEWTTVAPTRLINRRSRFEVDLNRPRDRAVYQAPADAWDLPLWPQRPSPEVVERSLALYDQFYEVAHTRLAALASRYGRFVVYDLHSYNHRRDGPTAPPADPAGNPQVNLGTGTMDRARWQALVERFVADLRAHPFPGGALDVRENVRFRGGHFSRWVHQTFPDTACVLAIEFKKFFMDEWTGVPDRQLIEAIGAALHATVPGVLEGLSRP